MAESFFSFYSILEFHLHFQIGPYVLSGEPLIFTFFFTGLPNLTLPNRFNK